MMLKISFDHSNELHFNIHRKQLFQFVTIFHNFIELLFFKSNKCSPGEQKWYLTYILVFVSFDFGVKCNLERFTSCRIYLLEILDLILQDDAVGSVGFLPGHCDAILRRLAFLHHGYRRRSWEQNSYISPYFSPQIKQNMYFLCDAVKPWCNVL